MTALRKWPIIAGLTALVLVVGGLLAVQLMPAELPPSAVYTKDGIALGGTDPVAYFTEKRAVKGSAEHSTQWNGATWTFASAANKDKFLSDPASYAPQYGGFCAWAVGAKAQLFSTNPNNWSIVDNKLYLNYNDQVQTMWDKDKPGFIQKADDNWPAISTPKKSS